jgi:hypothetical protein
MKIFEFASIDVSSFFDSFHQTSNPLLSLFDFIVKLIDIPLMVFSLLFNESIFFLQETFHLFFIPFQCIYDLLISLIQLFQVTSMNFHKFLFKVIQFLLSFPLDFVDLLFQGCCLSY